MGILYRGINIYTQPAPSAVDDSVTRWAGSPRHNRGGSRRLNTHLMVVRERIMERRVTVGNESAGFPEQTPSNKHLFSPFRPATPPTLAKCPQCVDTRAPIVTDLALSVAVDVLPSVTNLPNPTLFITPR